MTVITFSASGEPRRQERPRARVLRGKFAQFYKPPMSRAYEASLRRIAVEVMDGRPPLEGALSLSLRFRMGVPKSMSKGHRPRLLAGEEPFFGRCDLSNMVKAVEDAMNKVVFVDDRQITRLFATKVAHERPGVDVRVEAFE